MNDYNKLKNEIDEGTLTFRWDFGAKIEMPDGFNDWFFKNAVFLGEIDKILNDTIVKQDTHGQCFHNSQLVDLENKDIKYYEGLIYGPKYKKCFH